MATLVLVTLRELAMAAPLRPGRMILEPCLAAPTTARPRTCRIFALAVTIEAP